MLAAIYVRVSTAEQAEKGYSVPSQIEACRGRAMQMKAAEVLQFVDNGYSGADLDRPALNNLRAAVKDKRVSAVICYDPDRFARRLMHQLIITEEFEKAGCQLEFVNFEWKDTPEGKLFYSMRGAISEYEREKIRERTVRGKLQKAKEGKIVVPNTIIGLKWDQVLGVYIEDPLRAEVVRNIFKMMAYEKMSTRSIAEKLTNLGVPVPSSGSRKFRSNKWSKKTVGAIIRNPTYAGEYFYNRYRHVKRINKEGKTVKNIIERPRDEWIGIRVQPLVKKDLFELANKQLNINGHLGRQVKKDYLLRGLLKCAKCANNFGATTGSAGRHYRCYGTSKSAGKVCNAGILNADKTEAIIWQAVKEVLKKPERILAALEKRQAGSARKQANGEAAFNRLHAELRNTEHKKQEFLSLYRAELITKDEVGKELSILKEKLNILRKQKDEAENIVKLQYLSQEKAGELRSISIKAAEYLEKLNYKQKREVMELFIAKIMVTVEHSRSPYGQKIFEIHGIMPVGILDNETTPVGEVPQTYLNLDVSKGKAENLLK